MQASFSHIREEHLYVDGIGGLGTNKRRKRIGIRDAPVVGALYFDLRDLLFHADPTSAEKAEAAKGDDGGIEEGRQGGHGLGNLGHRYQSWKRHGDAADRR